QGVPVVRRAVGQAQAEAVGIARADLRPADPRPAPQLGRRARERALDVAVEAPAAAEAGHERHLAAVERGLVEELLREVDAAGEGDGERRRARVREEEPPEVARGDAEAAGQALHAVVVEGALSDEAQGAGDDARRAEPRGRAGRRLGPTAQAGTEPGGLRGGRAREVADVLVLGGTGRAHGPTIDPRGRHADEEAAVPPRVAGAARAIAGPAVELHGCELTKAGPPGWPETDLEARGRAR